MLKKQMRIQISAGDAMSQSPNTKLNRIKCFNASTFLNRLLQNQARFIRGEAQPLCHSARARYPGSFSVIVGSVPSG